MTIEYITHNDSHLFYFSGKIFKHYQSISIREFEWWLRREGKLETIMTLMIDSAFTQDVHAQMTFDEYMDNVDMKEIEKDIALFITQSKTN